jgi:hypothetical protein
MSLPSAWVDRIFSKLTVAYGHRFLGLYSGIDLDAVKADWAEELTSFQQAPNAVRFALENLPSDHPPNVFQFRDLCRQAPQYAPQKLPDLTKPDPVLAKAVRETFKPVGANGDREWAKRLRQRALNGYRLTRYQRDALAEVGE